MSRAVRDEPARPCIPDHAVHRCIGEGSYGQVWLARTVMGAWRAVKVIRRDLFENASSYEREFSGVRRFEPLSRSHEGFVDVLQTGEDAAGGCFHYVMELADDLAAAGLEGAGRAELDPAGYQPRTLASDLRVRGRLPAAECIEIGFLLADALTRLHAEQLIHRDIKPSNIVFVGGRPKLADIGLVVGVAEAKSYVGTEGYVAPEGPNSVHADLYSLGIVLYEAAMGMDRRCFPSPGPAMRAGPDAVLLRELNAVLLRACATRREDRYGSAADMAFDLALLRAGGSVQERQRHQRLVRGGARLAAVTLAVVAMAWTGMEVWQRRAARQIESGVAEARRQGAEGVRQILADDLGAAAVHLAESLPALQARPQESEVQRIRLRQALNHVPRPLLTLAVGVAPVCSVAFSPDGRRLATGDASGSACVWDALDGSCISRFQGMGGAVDVRFSRDGQRLLVGPSSVNPQYSDWKASRAVVLDASSGKPVGVDVRGIELGIFSPDDRTLAVVQRGEPEVRLIDTMSGQLRRLLQGHLEMPVSLAFSTDGSLVASGGIGADRTVRVWKVEDGTVHGVPARFAENVKGIVFSPRDDRLLVSTGNGPSGASMSMLDLVGSPKARPIAQSPGLRPVAGVMAMGGRRVVVSDVPGGVSVRSAADGLVVLPGLELPSGHGISHAVGPDDSLLVMGSDDGWVQAWDLQSGSPLAHPCRVEGAVYAVAFSPDSTRLAAGSQHGVVRTWDITARTEAVEPLALKGLPPALAHPRFPYPAAVVADEGFATLRDADGRSFFSFVELASGRLHESPSLPIPTSSAIVVPAPHGRTWATMNLLMSPLAGHQDVLVTSWGADGWGWRRLPHALAPAAVQFTPDATRILTMDRAGKVRAWRTDNGQLDREVTLARTDPASPIILPAFSPDSRTVFWTETAIRTQLFFASWEVPRVVVGQCTLDAPITSHACHPVEPWVAVRTSDHRIRLFPCQDGKMTRLEAPVLDGIHCTSLKWNPCRRQMLVERDDGRFILVDLHRSTTYPVPGPPGGVASPVADFSPDGRWIVASLSDGRVWVADADTGEPVTPWISHPERVRFAAIISGDRWMTLDGKGVLRTWDLRPATSSAESLRDAAVLVSGRHLKGGSLEWMAPAAIAAWDKRLRASPDPCELPVPNPARWHLSRAASADSIVGLESAWFHAWRAGSMVAPDVHRALEGHLVGRGIASRDPATPGTVLDLTRFYTHSLDMLPRAEFRELPRGHVVLDGIPFDVRGLVRLEPPAFRSMLHAMAAPLFGSFPLTDVHGIPVGRPCQRIHILHGVDGDFLVHGEEYGRWRIRFANGTEREFPLVFDRDSPRGAASKSPSGRLVAWSAPATPSDRRSQLLRFTWTNPEPTNLVESLDLVAGEGRSRPFVVSITVE